MKYLSGGIFTGKSVRAHGRASPSAQGRGPASFTCEYAAT